jgi:hypothetical protein
MTVYCSLTRPLWKHNNNNNNNNNNNDDDNDDVNIFYLSDNTGQ